MCFVKIPEKCLGINRCWEVGRMMKVTQLLLEYEVITENICNYEYIQ